MSVDKPFTKENLDSYLKELAKEFRKKNGTRMPAEIVLIGGASILINYGFREMTYDMDAIIKSSGAMKDAINTVGDRLGSNAYTEQLAETGSGKGAYNSFVVGFLYGVRDAFDEQCTALMVITPKEVEEDWESFSANMKTSKSSFTVADRKLYEKGYAEGKQAVKSRAIED